MRQKSDLTDPPLIIDRAAAAENPSSQALHEWGSDKRIFISSVMSELSEERQAAADAIRSIGARPILFEEFGGRDADPENAYLAEVESSDIYIGILGTRYGKPLKSRYSATHAEYRHGELNGLRIAVWVSATPNREGPEQSFLDEVRTFYVAPEFTSPSNLKLQIVERLRAIAAEDLAPWCKLREFVFRANEVIDNGKTIEVRGKVRGDDVAHGLEQLRPGQRGRGEPCQFSWQGRSRQVSMKNLEVTMTSARSRNVRIVLETSDAQRNGLLDVGVNNIGPDDLTEAAIRSALFGEPNPLLQQNMGFLAKIPDPWLPLRERAVSEEIIRPIAELLLVDELVGSGRVARITSFRLGVNIQGRRKCEVAFQTPRRYANERETIRRMEGTVTL